MRYTVISLFRAALVFGVRPSLFLIVALSGSYVWAQSIVMPLGCSAKSAAVAPLAAGGPAELVGEVVIQCTGGAPGSLSTGVSIAYNADVARNSTYGFPAPQLVINDPPAVGLSAGTSTVTGVASGNVVQFQNVTMPIPGASTLTLRVKNVRLDTRNLNAPIDTPVFAYFLRVEFSGSTSISVVQTEQGVGRTTSCTGTVSTPPTTPSAQAPPTISVPAPPGTLSVGFTPTDAGCPWVVRSDAPWLTFASGLNAVSLSGLNSTTLTVLANTTGVDRSTPLFVAGRMFVVTQAAAPTTPPLTITTTALSDLVLNKAYTGFLQATGGAPPYSWAWVSGLIPGLAVAPNGLLTGTPTAVANGSIATFSVTDSRGVKTSRDVRITVSSAAVDWEATVLPAGVVGRPYTAALRVVSGAQPPFVFTLGAGAPAGLSLSPGSSNGYDATLSGTPLTTANAITVQIRDGAGIRNQRTFPLSIGPALSLTAVDLPIGTVGTAYNASLRAAGGIAPYSWKLLSGSLGGLALNPQSGDVTGIPNAVPSTTIMIQVSDRDGYTASRNYMFPIAAPLGFTALTMPPGQVGSGYAQTLAVSGGTPPYTWSLVSGLLPAGLRLEPSAGLLSGVPLSAGTSVSTIAVTDAAGRRASREFTLNVSVAPMLPAFSAAGVLQGASFQSGPVSPGQVVTLFGEQLGPSTLAVLAFDANGRVATQLAGTRVLFNNIPAPLLYTSSTQIGAIVPLGIAESKTAVVEVEYQGQRSAAVQLPVVSAVPGWFTASATGRGGAAALNEDGSLNRLDAPAERGSILVLYATGTGLWDRPVNDGEIAAIPLARPRVPVHVFIDGIPAEVLYAGAAPGLVSGLLQVNVRIPAGVAAGAAIPVMLEVDGAQSPAGVTVAIR